MNNKIGIALIGYGYWGPNYARIITGSNSAELMSICDIDPGRLQDASQKYPGLEYYNTPQQAVASENIDAVVLATPVENHESITREALLAGKHVLCEKPLARTSDNVRDLGSLAMKQGKVLMSAQIFEYNSVVRYMKNYLNMDDIGRILYIHSERCGLGPVRKDVNVVYDLATHDISIILYLLDLMPISVAATGSCYVNEGVEDIAFINLEFANDLKATIQVSWLDPIKQRKMRVIGSKKMLVFDDVSLSEKFKIINAGKSYLENDGDFGSFQLSIKDGDIIIPNIHYKEPLTEEFNHFLECITDGKTPLTDVNSALRVVRVLEAINTSLSNNGERTTL